MLASCSVTESEQRKIQLFNMISQELTSIKERGPTVLSRMLKNEKGGSSTDLLLIIKKWGEFFLRFRKNNPEFSRLLNSSDLNSTAKQRWILEVVRDGIRDNLDYSLVSKSFVFQILESQWCIVVMNTGLVTSRWKMCLRGACRVNRPRLNTIIR